MLSLDDSAESDSAEKEPCLLDAYWQDASARPDSEATGGTEVFLVWSFKVCSYQTYRKLPWKPPPEQLPIKRESSP